MIKFWLTSICCESTNRLLESNLYLDLGGRKMSFTFEEGEELKEAFCAVFGEKQYGIFYMRGDFDRKEDVILIRKICCSDKDKYERGVEKIAALINSMLGFTSYTVDFSDVKTVTNFKVSEGEHIASGAEG